MFKLSGNFSIKWRYVAFCLVSCIPVAAHSQTNTYLTEILQNLYQNSGYPNIKKPQIKVVKSREFAARYVPLKNEIQLEDTLLKICRSFGLDSSNALAFIIAHEYSHALLEKDQKNLPSHFVHVHHSQTGKAIDEFTSDIYGLFMSYLAGYQPERILEKLLEQIYATYKISEERTISYPSKEDRLRSQKILYQQILPFIHLFDVANVLAVKGQYELAAASYERILKIYRGIEIYNNLGVVYTLRALENFDEDLDMYAYPIELDYNTGLKKIRKSRGPLTMEMKRDRKMWLDKAKIKFQEALIINKDYNAAHFNFICSMMLSGESSQAHKYIISLTRLNKNLRKNAQLELVTGINYALLSDYRAALVLKEVQKSKNQKLKQYAAHNLKISKKEKPSFGNLNSGSINCSDWSIENADSVKREYRFLPVDTIELDFEKKKITFGFPRTSLRSFFHFSLGEKLFMEIQYRKVLQDHPVKQFFANTTSSSLKRVDSHQGSFVECEASGYLYLLENKNRNLKGIELKIFD